MPSRVLRTRSMPSELKRLHSRRDVPLVCDVCGIPRPTGHVRPFTLVANVQTVSGDTRVRSFGSLDVCRDCWRTKAAPNRRRTSSRTPWETV